MYFYLSLDGINKTLENLEKFGFVSTADTKKSLWEKGLEIRNVARENLEANLIRGVNKDKRIKARPGYKYSTGKLGEHISVEPVSDEKNLLGITVGVNPKEVTYAEWVEVGHRIIQWHSKSNPKNIVGGKWWPGYHFMENAYLTVGPTIEKAVGDSLKVILTSFKREAGKRSKSRLNGKYVR